MNGEMTESMTEPIDIELEGGVIARANADFIIISEVFIHLSNIILLRECVEDALIEFTLVGVVVE